MTLIKRFPIAFYMSAAFAITYVIGIGAYFLLKTAQARLGTHVPDPGA
jgi:hypothetical protein